MRPDSLGGAMIMTSILLMAVPGSVAGEDDLLEAEPIVVSGEREPGALRDDATEDRETVEGQTIDAKAASNAAEIIGKMPGFRTQTRVQGEKAAVSIEGLPPEYTRILVDGHRFSGQLGEVDDLTDIPLTNVERIEVLRGSQALRHGAEAGGGVIDVITRRAPETGVRLDTDTGYGSDGHLRGAGTAAFRVGGTGVTTSLTHEQIRGFDPEPGAGAVFTGGGGRDSRLLSDDLYTTFERRIGDRLSLDGTLGWRREDEDIVPSDGDASSSRLFTRWLTSGGARFALREGTNMSADASWYRGVTDSTAGRSFVQREQEPRLRLFADQAFDTGPFAHLLTVGGEFARPTARLDERGAAIGSTAAAEDVDAHFGAAGFILQDEIDVSSRVTLSGGLRLQLHSAFEREWLPQVGILVRPHERLRLRASLGRNARQPSLTDLYQGPVPQLGGAYFLAGNSALTTETSHSLRAGFDFTPTDHVGIAVTGFWNRVDDLIRSMQDGEVVIGNEITPAPIGPSDPLFPFCSTLPPELCQPVVNEITRPIFRKTNLDRVRTRGIEAQLRLRPHERITVDAGWTWLDSRVQAASLPNLRTLPNEPRHTVDLGLTLQAPLSGTRLAIDARWRHRALRETSGTGLTSFASNEWSHPSWVVDLRVAQPLFGAHEIYLDVRNAFDRRVVDSYEIRGRTVFAGIRTSFGFAGAVPGRSHP